MSADATICEYYARIDRSDLDWVVAIFDSAAVYERADATYAGLEAIDRFFRKERHIRGVHHVDRIFTNAEEDTVVAIGRFQGAGKRGDARDVRFADIWEFNRSGRVARRRTFLALGSDYVRE